RVHAHVVVGAGNDELVGFQVLVEDHLPRIGALHPQVVGDLSLGGEQPSEFGTDAVDPVHASRAPSAPRFATPAKTPLPFIPRLAQSRQIAPSPPPRAPPMDAAPTPPTAARHGPDVWGPAVRGPAVRGPAVRGPIGLGPYRLGPHRFGAILLAILCWPP